MTQLLRTASWALASAVGPRIVQALKLILVTRLLGPSEFGAYSLGLVFVATADGLSELGVRQAVVQRATELNWEEASALNGLMAVRGLIVGLCIVGVAVVARSWWSDIDVLGVCFISTLPLLRGLYTVSYSTQLRRMSYRRLFAFDTSSRGADVAFTIAAMGVWGATSRVVLVAAPLGEVAAIVLSRFLLEVHVGFSRKFSLIADMIRYGRWIWGQSLLTVLVNQFDRLYVAGRFGLGAMGGYQGVSRLFQTALADPVLMVVQVWFPKVAQDIRSDQQRAAQQVSWVVNAVAATLVVVVTVLCATRNTLVEMAFGKDWIPFVGLVPIFGATMAIGALVAMLVMWHRAAGTPQMVTFGTLAQVVVYVPGVIALGSAGAMGVARAVHLSLITILIVLIATSGRAMLLELLRGWGTVLLMGTCAGFAFLPAVPIAFGWAAAAIGLVLGLKGVRGLRNRNMFRSSVRGCQ